MLIRVLDLETTGFEPPAGVCEIGYSDVVAYGRDLGGNPASWWVDDPGSVLVDPGQPITPETSAVHHITDEDVRGAKGWPDAARLIVGPNAMTWGDRQPIAYAAHSAKFEQKWITPDLTAGVPWICTYKCALRLWRDAPLHSNQGLRYWRRPEGLRRERAAFAHRAGPDAYVTAFHVRDLLALASLADLVAWSAEPALQVRCHIGKWRGTPWTEVDDGFLLWVADRDFDEDVLFTVRHELERREKERAAERKAARQSAPADDRIPF